MTLAPELMGPPGSSPLARGLPGRAARGRRRPGIIPARAGFTSLFFRRTMIRPDHPRSRGVYAHQSRPSLIILGSSPLARGLLLGLLLVSVQQRIIPARAGFTVESIFQGDCGSDHPRSRGVYENVIWENDRTPGSSPLARGLRLQRRRRGRRHRIIPARAGFTPETPAWGRPRPDHPRSRGVYNPETGR